MARFASWCEREEVRMCWKTVWKASSVLLAACSGGRNVGLFRPFRSLIENCRAWLLPEGKSAQRYSAPWLEWMSESLSVLCWLEEYTLDIRGNRWQQLLASRRIKYLPERVRTGISKMAESILMHSRTLLRGSPDSYWDLSTKRHQMGALCMFSVAALLNMLALHRPADLAQDAPLGALVGPRLGSLNTLVG